jgi:hypothetical protein
MLSFFKVELDERGKGFNEYSVQPKEAFYNAEMGEFLLPYDIVRTADFPDDVSLAFLQVLMEQPQLVVNGIEIRNISLVVTDTYNV